TGPSSRGPAAWPSCSSRRCAECAAQPDPARTVSPCRRARYARGMADPISSPRIYLAYTADELERYYSPGALAALEALGEVVRNDTGSVIEKAALVDEARDCDIVIAHRSVALDAEFFE